MPGVPMMIGNHNNTIFLPWASQFCAELDTKEETVSTLLERSFRRICVRAGKQIISKVAVEQSFALRGARPVPESNLVCALSQAGIVGTKLQARIVQHNKEVRRE
jgi:hypothetical protein